MATRGGGSAGRSFGFFILGFLVALLAVVGAGWAYLHFGHLPVATGDPAFPLEAQLVRVPLHARIEHDMRQPPFGISEDVYEAGAHIYIQQCAACHGVPGKDVGYARWMYPRAPQLWRKHAHGNVVGVSDDPAGETFWKVQNGVRLTGMPSYKHILSEDQMWDVSLLLHNADQELPDPVSAILKGK